jgi:class 3 adenylate cyclase
VSSPPTSKPTGTVTFLFTDIEGSTKMWERNPSVMQKALSRHDEILSSAIEANGGYVFKTVGDAAPLSPALRRHSALPWRGSGLCWPKGGTRGA